MRILIIGGTGFIGPYVIQQLTAMGHELALFNRGRSNPVLNANVVHIQGDLEQVREYREAFARFQPDVVLHMIARTEKETSDVMDAVRGIAGRIVVLSSMDVYRAYGLIKRLETGPVDPVPLTEESPLRERMYPCQGIGERLRDYEKILVERVVLCDTELQGTVLRLPMVYGPGDEQHRLYKYIKRMQDGRNKILIDEAMYGWRTTRGYVKDVAQAIVLAVTSHQSAGHIYNVGEPIAWTEAEWVAEIGKAMGWEGEVISVPKRYLPDHLAVSADLRQDWVIDTTRIRTELGFNESVALAEAIRRTVAWELNNPPEDVHPKEFDYQAEDRLFVVLQE